MRGTMLELRGAGMWGQLVIAVPLVIMEIIATYIFHKQDLTLAIIPTGISIMAH
jgi:hypothetical protein